jgi:hypothetical protein
MNNYVIEYEVVGVLSGNRSERLKTVQPIHAESKYNAVAMLAQRINDHHRNWIDIFTVEEIN